METFQVHSPMPPMRFLAVLTLALLAAAATVLLAWHLSVPGGADGAPYAASGLALAALIALLARLWLLWHERRRASGRAS